MKKEKRTTGMRLFLAAAMMALLAAAVFFVFPRVLPYEKVDVLYGLVESKDMKPVSAFAAGGGDQQALLAMNHLLSMPESFLLVNGQRYAQITHEQADGEEYVVFDGTLLEQPGELRLCVEFCYHPLLRLKTNTVTIPIK